MNELDWLLDEADDLALALGRTPMLYAVPKAYSMRETRPDVLAAFLRLYGSVAETYFKDGVLRDNWRKLHEEKWK